MRGIVLAITVVGWLVPAGPAAAITLQVRDNARLFGPAKKEASNEIKEIRNRYHADLVVETFQSVPWSFLPWSRGYKLKQMDEAARAQFYADWARERAGKMGPKTIYVLICTQPAPLVVQVAVGSDRRLEQAFSPGDREQLRRLLLARFAQGRYDEGLLDGVGFVQKTLHDHLGDTLAGPPAFDWTRMLGVIGVVLAVWLVLECTRVLRRAEPAVSFADAGIHGYNGGGSFFPALFATLACGGLRHVFRGGPPQPCPPPPGAAEQHEARPPDDERASEIPT